MRPRNMLGTLSLAVVLLATGCNGEAPQAHPTPPASSSPSGGGSSPSAPSSTAPGADAATGRLMKTSDATVNAPQGWNTVLSKTYDYLTLGSPDGLSAVTISDFGTVTNADTERLVRQTAKNDDPKSPTIESADLGMAPGVHMSYQDSSFATDVYGAIEENVFVYVQFILYKDVPASKRQQIIDSVLASFRWK